MPLNYSPFTDQSAGYLTPLRAALRIAGSTSTVEVSDHKTTKIGRYLLPMLTILGLSTLALSTTMAQSTSESQSVARLLAQLPQSTASEIETKCLPEQYRKGAAGYRECVESEIELRNPTQPAASVSSAPALASPETPTQNDQVVAKSFDALAQDDKYAIQRTCQRYLGSDGKAYSNCVGDELASLQKISPPNMSTLSSDEQFAVRQSCFNAQTNDGAAAYRRCLNLEVADLSQIPPVSMAGLSTVETTKLQLECSPSSKIQTAAEYRICLGLSLERLLKSKRDQKITAGTGETVVAIKPQEIQPISDKTSVTAAAQDVDLPSTPQGSAISDAVQSPIETVAQVSAEEVLSNSVSSTSQETKPATPTRIIPKPAGLDFGEESSSFSEATEPADSELKNARIVDGNSSGRVSVSTLTSTDVTAQQASTSADTTETSSGEESTPASLSELIDKLKTFDIGSFLGDHPAADYARYISLILPAIFLWTLYRLLSLFGRSRRRSPEEHAAPKVRIDDPLFDDLPDQASAAQFEQTTEVENLNGSKPTSRLSDRVRPDMSRQQATVPAVNAQLEPDIELEGEASLKQAHSDEPLPPVYQEISGEYSQWLTTHSDSEQKKFCVEFLLYWVTYGEGKYDPELKSAILEATELNEHDIIKKHIFLKDTDALISTLKITREKFNAQELSQILNLMFAVLVEHTVSPTQNIFFRFFADFAGIGADGLSKKYQQSFGAPLPPVPRPDDARWWAKRKELEELKPHVARTERDVMLTRLGLKEPIGPDDIHLAYEHIDARFAEENFDQLGDKERKLVRRHLINYAHARDFLLEDFS